tara:strand:+ start:90 stop:830 length:741 start_codon:yes stop_codon:yes gene_type:complete
MRTFHGHGLEKKFGLKLSRDKMGLWTGTQVYTCLRENFAWVVPGQGSSHEDFPFLTVDEIESVEGLEGGMMKIVAKYAGKLGASDEEGEGENVPEYNLEVTTSDEPLATHPKYDALDSYDRAEAVELATNPPMEDDGESLKEIDTSEWSENKQELYGKIRIGIEAFRDPKVVWSKRWVSESLPANLNKTGEIDEPGGSEPGVAADRNWLYLGARTRIRGKVYEIEESWELSGRGGWDEDLYGPGAE